MLRAITDHTIIIRSVPGSQLDNAGRQRLLVLDSLTEGVRATKEQNELLSSSILEGSNSATITIGGISDVKDLDRAASSFRPLGLWPDSCTRTVLSSRSAFHFPTASNGRP